MANYQQLKAAIDQVIKANGQKEITGPVLNDTLKAIVNSLGAGYQFMGVATPSSNPGTPDQNVFYLAGQAGTYTNFNSIILTNGVSVIKWNGSWSSETVVAGDGVFDISAYKATGGTLATFADLSAALDGGNNIPSALRKGGMSVKFIQGTVQSSDNKYVQCRCITDEFTTDTTQWAIYEDGVLVENPEFAEVHTDIEDKILYGVKQNGDFYFGAGVPSQVQEELDNKVDEAAANKVDKEEGKSLIDADYASSQSAIDNPEYLQVTTDAEGRIIEGVNINGEKRVSKFDSETENTIKNIVGDGASDIVNISKLDANFSSPIPVIITGTKGDENAKYEFELPVKDSWIVRFKFRITENLLNQEKDAEIASINGAKVTAKVFPLTQHQEIYNYEGIDHTEHWPTFDGGIAFNRDEINNYLYGRNLGQQAFSIKYIGSADAVTIENDGEQLILTEDGISTTYIFENYGNVSELFQAISQNPNLELQYIALDQRTCDELAIFSPIWLKDTFYTDETGSYGESMNIEPHIDCAPFYLYYAVSEKWHQVEIFKIGNTLYSYCDGNKVQHTISSNDGKLILGGDCGVLFKDFVFCGNGLLDTELITGDLCSSVSPYVLVFECHGMYDGPAYSVTPQETEGGMSSINPDTLEYFYKLMDEKGYMPVTINDIAEYYATGKPLPKRCYVHIFDDWRWNICLDLNYRRVFKKHCANPALALITNSASPIYFNGVSITEKEAAQICKDNGFGLVSHTKSHRNMPRGTKPSQYISYLTEDIIDADNKNIDGSVMVYPGGMSNVYMHDVMEYLGFRLGIQVTYDNSITNISHSKFNISRVNIGRLVREDGTKVPYWAFTNKII